MKGRHTIQWFYKRIGKEVERLPNKCELRNCSNENQRVIRLKIIDKEHADYLFLVSQELGIDYFDPK